MLERDWNNIWERDKEDLYGLCLVATAVCVIITGYFRGLQGEEINKIDVSATRKYWEGSTKHVKYPHVL